MNRQAIRCIGCNSVVDFNNLVDKPVSIEKGQVVSDYFCPTCDVLIGRGKRRGTYNTNGGKH